MGRIQNFSLLFVLFLATTFASAEEVVKDGIHYRVIELSDGSTLLEVYNPDGTPYEGNLVIPDKVEVAEGVFYDVVSISESAFAGSTGLTSISIPNSVRNVGRNAFNGCSGIKSLEIPSGITLIEEGAFGNCANLSDLIITERENGETLTIEGKAFSPGTNSVSLNIFSEALTPPEASDDTFYGYTIIQLYCTADGLPDYMDTSPWCDFYPTVFSVQIEPQELPAEELEITLVQEGPYTYTGSEIKPGITLKWIIEEQETTIPEEEYTVSYADNINAGTATVTVTDKEDGNYTFESVSKTFEITPAKGRLEYLLLQKPTAIDNLSYTGEAQNLIQPGIINEEIFKGQLKYSLDNSVFVTDIPQGTKAQVYTVYYKAEGDPNYTASNTLSLTVTIKAEGISLSAENISLEEDSYIYDGTAKEPAVTVKTGETTIPAEEYTVSYADNINAGTATVTVTDKEGGIYTFESVSKTFEITPAKGSLEYLLLQKPTAIDNLSYTGEAQNLIQPGIINEEIFKGQLKYSLDNIAFATDIPQGTEAQEYTVYYKAEGDPNYTASNTLSLTVIIKAEGISLSAENISLEEDSYIYDGTAKEPAVTVRTGETTIPAEEYTVSYADNINAGTATVTITDKEGGNYTFESVSKTFEITPAKGRLEYLLLQKPTAIDNLSYTGEAQNLIQPGIINEEIFKGQLKYSLDNSVFATDIPQGTKAQDYTVYYKAEGDPNYTISDTLSLTVTIKAGAIALSAENISLEEDSYIYDGTAKEPAVTVKTGETTIPEEEYTVSYADNINAGTATVTVTDKEGGNYTFESVSKTFEITPAKGRLEHLLTQKPTAIDNLSYTGAAQNLIQAGIINEEIFKGQLKYSLDNIAFATDIPQGTKAQEYTVYYKAEGDPNYTASDTLSLTVTIKAETISLSAENISLEEVSYVYDGTAKEPAVTVKTGETTIPAEEYTVSYADNINAGTATVTITDKEGGNYTFESVSKTFEITPAKGRLEYLLLQKPTAIDNLSYTGEAQDLIQPGIINEEIFKGQLKYSLDNIAFATDIPQGTKAQDYTVYYKAEGDPNYTASDTLSLTVTIKAVSALSISLGYYSSTYDGTEKKPDIIVKWIMGIQETIIPTEEYIVSYSNNINVGTATVTITDKEGGNYNVSGSKTFTITKAPLTISADSYEIFEGERIPEFTLTYDGFVNNETEEVLTAKPIVSCNGTATSKPGDYTISVGGAKAANYDITHKSGKLTIIAMKFVSGGESSKDEDDAATYQITSTGRDAGTTPTVAIVDDKDVGGSFAIPEAVTYHNTNYIVTEISESAFENNKYLTNVTIPSSITNIGDKAFKGCSNLKSITVYITTPISLAVAGIRGERTRSDGSSVFEGVDKDTCILYVPDGSIDLYKAAPVWNEFEHIVSISTTGIKGVTMTDDEFFDIYNLQGQKVKSKTTNLNGLPRGIYIINGKKYPLK